MDSNSAQSREDFFEFLTRKEGDLVSSAARRIIDEMRDQGNDQVLDLLEIRRRAEAEVYKDEFNAWDSIEPVSMIASLTNPTKKLLQK